MLTFLSLARDALVALLLEHGKDEQVEPLMRGELTMLDLDSCLIGDDGAEIVADFFALEDVKTVLLWKCGIGPRGAKAIAESLKHNPAVEYMYLPENQIGAEGTEAIIEALKYNVCMECLDILGFDIAGSSELHGSIESIEYLTRTRNTILIPAAVRRASLCLLAARRNITNAGTLAIFPKEIVKIIAMEVWATRKDPIWLNALTESERTGESGD